jgi:hypothetical protein
MKKLETLLYIGQRWVRRRDKLEVTIDTIGRTKIGVCSCVELIVYDTPKKTFLKNYTPGVQSCRRRLP